jgi:hypothetical protein
MAVTKGKKGTTKASSNSESNKPSFKYGRSTTVFWQHGETMLSLGIRKNTDKNYNDILVRINNLDEDGKFIKNEDGNYDGGYFPVSPNEALKIYYILEKMYPTNGEPADDAPTGVILNHISKENNTGSQLELTLEENGLYLTIMYVTDGEATEENTWYHLLDNDQTVDYYDDSGEIAKETINLDIYAIKEIFRSAYGIASGLTEAMIECAGGGSGSGSKTGGIIKNRPDRKTIGKASKESLNDEDEEVDDSDDEEVEEKPAKKTIKKVKGSSSSSKSKKKPVTGHNLQKLLVDDDAEDDE